jgi:hypothetical protein
MLGYTIEDVFTMKQSINLASFYLPPTQAEVLKPGLEMAIDLLEGLLVEGRI